MKKRAPLYAVIALVVLLLPQAGFAKTVTAESDWLSLNAQAIAPLLGPNGAASNIFAVLRADTVYAPNPARVYDTAYDGYSLPPFLTAGTVVEGGIPVAQVSYTVSATDGNGVPLKDGDSVAPGSTITFQIAPRSSSDIVLFGTSPTLFPQGVPGSGPATAIDPGPAGEAPGYWQDFSPVTFSGSSLVLQENNPYGKSNDQLRTQLLTLTDDNQFSLPVPSRSFSPGAGLSCGSLSASGSVTCTVTGAGALSPSFIFGAVSGAPSGTYQMHVEQGTYNQNLDGHGATVPWKLVAEQNPETFGTGAPPGSGCYTGDCGGSTGTPFPVTLSVPATSVPFSFTVAGPSAQIAPPSVSCPSSLLVGEAGSFTFSASDPQNLDIRYGVDWAQTGSVNEWAPAVGYVSSGTSQTVTHSWNTPGTYLVQGLVQNNANASSLWAPCSVVVTDSGKPQALLTATPGDIESGSASTLQWTCINSVSASLDNAIGSLASLTGTMSVNPSNTTTYTVSCVGPGGVATSGTGVGSGGPNGPISGHLTPEGTTASTPVYSSVDTDGMRCTGSVISGTSNSSTEDVPVISQGNQRLWLDSGESANPPGNSPAGYCFEVDMHQQACDNTSGCVPFTRVSSAWYAGAGTREALASEYPPSSAKSGSPAQAWYGTKTFTAAPTPSVPPTTPTNPTPPVQPPGVVIATDSATVNVHGGGSGCSGCTGGSPGGPSAPGSPGGPGTPGAVSALLNADPLSIVRGLSSHLTWNSSGATTCTGNGFDTKGKTSGQLDVLPLLTTLYTITCDDGAGHQAFDAQTVEVTAPQLSITASPQLVRSGETSVISWSVKGKISACEVSGPGLFSSQSSGQSPQVITGESTYTLSCSAGAYDPTKSVTVKILPKPIEF